LVEFYCAASPGLVRQLRGQIGRNSKLVVLNTQFQTQGVNMAGSVTIHDVAVKAGVSIKTVSRVVNKEANVREKTQKKVREAIESLKYRPNQAARGLAGRRSYLIGLLYDNPSPSYLANLQRGVLAACHEVSYGLALRPAAFGQEDMIPAVIGWLKQSAIDGVLLTPPLSDSAQLVAAIQAEGVPCVVVSTVGPGTVPAVVIDEKEAARQITLHLIETGHKAIAFIKGHPDHYASKHRYAGFCEAMQAAGLAVDPQLVKQGYFDFASGKEAGLALLDMSRRPSAVFASNDDMAAGVMHAAHGRKLQIPEDLAVVGFDDTPLSRQVWPSLTTVRQPIRDMGHAAAEILLRSIGGNNSKRADEEPISQFDFDIKVRGSSMAAATDTEVAAAPARPGPSVRRL
jgi:LacI family transcriptional regulator, galactose operon repressor